MRKSSVVVIVLVLLVVMLGVGAVGYLSKGFQNWDYKDWFKDKQDIEVGVKDNEGNVMNPDKVYPMPASIGFSTVTDKDPAKATVNLVATVQPSNATIKNVTWSVEWVGAFSGTWNGATDKTTDYIVLSNVPDNDSAITATVLKPFGQKLKIVAKSKDNPALKAETVVDYVSDQFEFFRFNDGSIKSAAPYYDTYPSDMLHVFSPPLATVKDGVIDKMLFGGDISEMVVCTVRDDYTFTYNFRFVEEFVNYIDSKITGYYCTPNSIPLPLQSSEEGLQGDNIVIIDFSVDKMLPFLQGSAGDGGMEAHVDYKSYNSFMKSMLVYQQETDGFVFCIDVDIVGTYNNASYEFRFDIKSDSVYYYNTGLTVDTDHVLVGGVTNGVKYD